MKLKNPLDKFTSHSIHYILLGADSTFSLEPFAENVELNGSASLDAIDAAKYLGDEVSYMGRTAYVMIDTRKFSQFTIQDVKTKVNPTSMGTNGTISPNSITSELSFTVVDPMGVLFANFLQYITDTKLKVSFSGLACMFRVLFVGHLPDGTSETVMSVAIPCVFNKIKVDATDVKGIYECSMIPLIGIGTTSVSRWTNIGNATKFFTGQNTNTLGSMVRSFEGNLNDQSKKLFETVNRNSSERIGRRVEYMITIPEKWENYQMTGPNQGRVEETVFKKTPADSQPAPAKESNFSVPPSVSITQALDLMFAQCVEIAKHMNYDKAGAESTPFLTSYKHLVNVTSDTETFMVHVDVIEYTIPNTSKTGNTQELFYTYTSNGVQKTVPKNAVQFEYVYSGTNTDVLEFVMSIDNLNYVLLSPDKLGSTVLNDKVTTEGQQQKDSTGGEHTSSRLINNVKRNDPVLLNDKTWADKKNYSNIAANVGASKENPKEIYQEAIKNLAAFYAAGGAPSASISIRGNPNLMTHTSFNNMIPHVKFSESTKSEYRKKFEETVIKTNNLTSMSKGTITPEQFSGKNFTSTPMFVKLDIYGQNTDMENYGLTTHEIDPAVDATKLFFDENYYMCFEIETEIVDGYGFRQKLHLTPYSIFGFTTNKGGKK